jgi:hypothetical protein
MKKVKICKNCGKNIDYHRAIDMACPMGRKHRILSYCQFYEDGQRFELKTPRKTCKKKIGS